MRKNNIKLSLLGQRYHLSLGIASLVKGHRRKAWTRVVPVSLLSVMIVFGSVAVPCSAEDDKADLALRPPTVNVSPGPEYADKARMFQGVPGLERARNGRLWATCIAAGLGEHVNDDGNQNYVMAVTSGDDGKTWSTLKFVIDPDKDGPVRAFDPCLWHDPQGRLWLFWAQSYMRDVRLGVWAIVTDNSGAEDPNWSKPRRLCDGLMLNKPMVLSGGSWLLPTAIWHRDNGVRVVQSADNGHTFRLLGTVNVPLPHRSPDEPHIVERKDKSLWMLVRTRYGIGESFSSDEGKTWTKLVPSKIKHPTARFFIRRLKSGKLLLVKHGPIDQQIGRSHLTAFLSDDDGKTWYGGLLLDERETVSYPDGVQSPDGTIYIIYDRSRYKDKNILMAVFTEKDVAEGRCVSERARLRVLINKATGFNPKNG